MTLAAVGVIWIGVATFARWRERRRDAPWGASADILAGGVLFILTLGFFWRTLSGDVFQPADGGDLVSFLFPTYRFAASTLAQGELPLWNPHLYGGAPLIGDIQAGFLYPPNLLLFLVWPDFPYAALQWMSALHLWWAGLGAYVLVRTLRPAGRQVGPLAALAGAIAFAFCDPLLIHFGNLNLIAVLSWLPWALAAFVRATEARSLAWAVASGALVALGAYAGHAQGTFLTALGLALYAVFEWTASAGDAARWRRASRSAFRLVLVAVVAGLLTAPILLPAIELAGLSARSEFTYQDTVGYSLSPAQVLGMLTPGFFGRGPALHWGLWQRVELPYVGVVALLMAIAAVVVAEAKARRDLVPWLGMAAVALALSLGVYAIVHGWLTVLAPYFGTLRAPARALVLWALPAAVLAAHGVEWLMAWARTSATENAGDALVDTPGTRSLRRFLGGGALVLVAIVTPLVYVTLLQSQESETVFLRASVAALALLLATASWIGTWLAVEGLRLRWYGANLFGGLAATLLFVELSATGAYTDISPQDPTAGFSHPEIIEFLRADGEPFRIDARTEIDGLWQPDSAALAGLDDVSGIDNPLTVAAWQDYLLATGGRDTDAYNLLNAKYVIARDGTPFPDNIEAAFDAPGELSVFRNSAAMPRSFLSQPAQGETGNDGDFILPDASVGSAQFVGRTPSEIRLTTQAQTEALLVLSDPWYPGWRATVNGQQAPVERVNQVMRGVRVPSGTADVTMTYAPQSWRWGVILFGVGVATVLFVFALRRPLQKLA